MRDKLADLWLLVRLLPLWLAFALVAAMEGEVPDGEVWP